MVTLTITRDSGSADLVRAYAVTLDGEKNWRAKECRDQNFSISSGVHTLRMKID